MISDFLGNIFHATINLIPGGHTLTGGSSAETLAVDAIQDSDGNFYLCGSTKDGIMSTTQYGSHGTIDAFLAKISFSGKLLWLNQLGGGNLSSTFPIKIKLGPSNTIIVAGKTSGLLDDPGPLTGFRPYGSHGPTDIYVSSFTRDGALNWVSQLGAGSGNPSTPSQLLLTSAGEIFVAGETNGAFVAGETNGALDDPGPPAFTQYGSHGNEDTFVANFTPSGVLNWVSQIGGGLGSQTELSQIVVSGTSEGIFLSGSVSTGTLDGSGLFFKYGTSGDQDAYLANFALNGSLNWVKQLGGGRSSQTQPSQMLISAGAASSISSIYVTGSVLSGELDYSPSVGFSQYGVSGDQDAYLSNFALNGTLNWVKQIGGGLDSQTLSSQMAISTGEGASIFIAGRTSGKLDNPGLQYGIRRTQDIYLAKFGLDGTLNWAAQLGGGPDSKTLSYQLEVSADGAIFIAGTATAQLLSPNYLPIGEHGTLDSFVAKYAMNGALSFVRQIGAASSSSNLSRILIDSLSPPNFYLFGSLDNQGRIDGRMNADLGVQNSYFMKFDADGKMQ